MFDGQGVTPQTKPTIADVQKVVASANGLRVDDFKSPDRHWIVAHPRQIAMALAYEMTGKSLQQVGRQFGGRDHSTVAYTCKKISAQAMAHPDLAAAMNEYRAAIRKSAAERPSPVTLPHVPPLHNNMKGRPRPKIRITVMPQAIADRADWWALRGELEPA